MGHSVINRKDGGNKYMSSPLQWLRLIYMRTWRKYSAALPFWFAKA